MTNPGAREDNEGLKFDETNNEILVRTSSYAKNSLGTVINPSTEEKQDNIITAIERVDVKTNINTSNNEMLVNLEGHQCSDNSTSSQLNADGVFLGSSWQDTLNYGVLSINVTTDQNSATDGLEIQWSSNGADIQDYDKFTISANKPKTFTFGPAERYYRIKYINGSGGTTTNFHLTSLLRRCYVKPSSHRIGDPIVGEDDAELVKAILSGSDDNGIFRNVKVTSDGSQLVKLIDSQNGKEISFTGTRALKVIEPVKLIGTNFNGTKDTNFWTETVTGSGAVTTAGQAILTTGVTANSTAKYQTVRKARFVATSFNQFRSVTQFSTAGTTNNIRRIGAYNEIDGYFFQLNGTTFSVVCRKGSSDTIVSSGSFNGKGGTTYVLDTNAHRFNIDYGNLSAQFYIDDILIHTFSGTTTTLSNTLNFPVTLENINSGGSISNVYLDVRVAAITRLGKADTLPIYKFINTNTTTICKYSAGTLQRIVNVDNAGTVTIYDNYAASGTQIAVIDTAKALGDLTFNCPFSNGLTIVTAGGAKVAIIYE